MGIGTAAAMENSMEVSQTTTRRVAVWFSNPTPGHTPRRNSNSERYIHLTFTAALFTTAKIWRQPKCPSTDEWIKKAWNIHTAGYYSAIRKNEIMPLAATWTDLQTIIRGEVRKTNITRYHLHVESKTWYKSTGLRNKNRLSATEKRLVVAKGHRWGGRRAWDPQRQTVVCSMDKQGPTVRHRELYSIPCDKPERKGRCMCNRVTLQKTLTQHCKSTFLQ